ncbi:Piso0_004840 [Millerozyma farinosa CBS 7064]|uniref:Piso0_004840 protein n=1 Tax=Pichia sorbitophila (strain ATCC MYA-4447 / BCRC 22081 / CBS 7064 / NBRC 10061 / NRRL Y-12695) TaxID=559304 RepID=G8Y0K3_PICSO|nr:Piso0_004840 [Millerozyma farinosa CBS 7064]
MGLNNPIPRSLKSESRKAAKILASFIKPNQIAGADQVIPPHILKNAKGLAVITVLKAGFLFSGRAGSGVIVARLPDGGWSAPSAVVTAGAGVGGQIGAEITDFVFILNNKAAVDAFSQFGSITLGANISVAAGPLGRNAEGAGAASMKGAAAVFAYSKTKGLFAGVSLEGSAIVERREANRKFYGENCKGRQILSGSVEPPPACDSLMRVLESRVFNNRLPYEDDDFYNDDYYDDIPDEFSDSTSGTYSTRSRRGTNTRRPRYAEDYGYSSDEYSDDDYDSYRRNRRNGPSTATSYGSGGGSRSAWEDDIYDKGGRSGRRSNVNDLNARLGNTRLSSHNGSGRSPKNSVSSSGGKQYSNQAIALYTFKGEQSGDLSFKKGDVIDIVKKSETTDDWWTGRNNGTTGIFPANYVELI